MRRLREIKKYAAIGIAIYCILKNASDRKLKIEQLKEENDKLRGKLEAAKKDYNSGFMTMYTVWMTLKDAKIDTKGLDIPEMDLKVLEDFIENGISYSH